MSGIRYVLESDDAEISYTPGITPGLTALTYSCAGEAPAEFTGNQITSAPTALGTLVSVALRISVDTGGERFGFFLPEPELGVGQTEQFTTVGVYETFGGPDSVPRRGPSWRSIGLAGTAEGVIVPLAGQPGAGDH
jgi:hypothetical protein